MTAGRTRPRSPATAELWGSARMRLAYDEYLAGQLALLIVRSTLVAARHRANLHRRDHRARRSRAALRADRRPACSPSTTSATTSPPRLRMSRLLQGDVGAGKTVVALMAHGRRRRERRTSALMSPTELLAAQHYRTIAASGRSRRPRRWRSSPVSCRPPSAAPSSKASLRAPTTSSSAPTRCSSPASSSTISASPSSTSSIASASHQRLALGEKGSHADLLAMTATPIPRTLVLTHFGDMAVSHPARKAARPAAHRHRGAADRTNTTASSLGCEARIARRRSSLLGLPAGRGKRSARLVVRRRPRRRADARSSATASPSSTAACPPPPRPTRWTAFQLRRDQHPRCHHRHRSRRRRPQRHHHDRRAR